jgi:hypothetical protein
MLVTGMLEVSADFAKAADTGYRKTRNCEVRCRWRRSAYPALGVCLSGTLAAQNPQDYVAWTRRSLANSLSSSARPR